MANDVKTKILGVSHTSLQRLFSTYLLDMTVAIDMKPPSKNIHYKQEREFLFTHLFLSH